MAFHSFTMLWMCEIKQKQGQNEYKIVKIQMYKSNIYFPPCNHHCIFCLVCFRPTDHKSCTEPYFPLTWKSLTSILKKVMMMICTLALALALAPGLGLDLVLVVSVYHIFPRHFPFYFVLEFEYK